MNGLTPEPVLDYTTIQRQVLDRDAEIQNPYSKDAQVTGIHNSRRYLGDRLFRTVKPHRILDPAASPLIAVKLHIVTRKTLGGIQTDLTGQAFAKDGSRIPGLYAAVVLPYAPPEPGARNQNSAERSADVRAGSVGLQGYER